jgi:hypothetical protein
MYKHGKKAWRMAWYDFLQDHPLCQECEKQGIKELATTPYNPSMESVKGEYLDLKNCIPICDKCYQRLSSKVKLIGIRVHYRKAETKKKLKGSVSSGE